jgi:hypothetical protein
MPIVRMMILVPFIRWEKAASKRSFPHCLRILMLSGTNQKQAFKQVLSAAPYFNGSLDAFAIRTALLDQLLGSPDFHSIAEGIFNATQGDASFFVESGPTSIAAAIAGVVSMPLLCNDYRESPLPEAEQYILI